MDYETRVVVKVFVSLLPIFLAVFRLIVVLPATNSPVIDNDDTHSLDTKSLFSGSNIMIFLGSGGHTGEMMKLVSNMDLTPLNRTWVISSNDTTSLLKCKQYESSISSDFKPQFLTLHRARSVGEPLISSVKNTVLSFVDTLQKVWQLPQLPSVLLINGPGTCVPIAYILFAFKYFGLCSTRIVYIESLARVHDMSLSGKLVLPIADRVVVQWASLAREYKRAEYYGILV